MAFYDTRHEQHTLPSLPSVVGMGACEFDPTGRFICVRGRSGKRDEVMFALLPEPDMRPIEELLKAARHLIAE